ncbi:hypothetical protein B0H19DRAFT_1060245 [Mycena capillaripes]|nr:hypothetical protein B0H19DRAFT_1060245 [Mycena capillaripes]
MIRQDRLHDPAAATTSVNALPEPQSLHHIADSAWFAVPVKDEAFPDVGDDGGGKKECGANVKKWPLLARFNQGSIWAWNNSTRDEFLAAALPFKVITPRYPLFLISWAILLDFLDILSLGWAFLLHSTFSEPYSIHIYWFPGVQNSYIAM